MSAFDHFNAEAVQFLRDLRATNTRDWFQTQKPVYETQIKVPAKAFAEAMQTALQDKTGVVHGSKIYRMHRDLRFSKDKRPYNAHLHISFDAEGEPGMWFFGLDPDKLTLGYGVFEFDKGRLPAVRDQLAGPAGRDLMDLIAGFETAGLRVSEPALKRVPAGFDKDHPHVPVLRRKGISVWRDYADPREATRPGLVERVMQEFEAFLPLRDFLNRLP